MADKLINPRTLEHQYDPVGGCFGRAFGTPAKPHGWGGNWYPDPPWPSTVGISPEQVDLSGYTQFGLCGATEFPVYGADGGITNIRYRVWTREAEDGKCYCIPFEDFI